MKIKFVRFGEVKIDGKRYTEDLVIVGGKIELRDKQPSKKHKKRFDGHTPLSIKETNSAGMQTVNCWNRCRGSAPSDEKDL